MCEVALGEFCVCVHRTVTQAVVPAPPFKEAPYSFGYSRGRPRATPQDRQANDKIVLPLATRFRVGLP